MKNIFHMNTSISNTAASSGQKGNAFLISDPIHRLTQNKFGMKYFTTSQPKKVFIKTPIISFLLFALLGLSITVYGQSASATWALTSSPGAPTVSGNVTATNISKGSGVGNFSFNSNGVSATSWEQTSLDANKYYQYTISPTTGYYLTVTGVSINYRIGDRVADQRMTAAVYYSLNSDFSSPTQLGSNLSVTKTYQAFSNSQSITVNDGITLYIRIFGWSAERNFGGWGADGGAVFRNYNVLISGTTSSSTSISTGAISGSTFCAGAAVSVPYTISGTYNSGNIFTAQLSDATGGFGSPVIIGSLTSVSAGTIAATIPPGTSTGTGYRIRVVSSNPVVTGSYNGSNLTVNALPGAVSVTGGGTFCSFPTLTASGGAGGTIYFQGTTSGGTDTGDPSSSKEITASGTYYFRAQSADGCWGEQGSTTVTLTGQPAVSVDGQTGPKCYGGSDGTITIKASLGTGSYAFSKFNGDAGTYFNGSGDTYTFTDCSANIPYKIRVKDLISGCESPAVP